MKITLDRIISITTLVVAVAAIVLVSKRPAPVALPPQAPAGIAANAKSSSAQSSSQKVDQPAQSVPQTQQPQPGGASYAAPQPVQNLPAPQSPKAEAHVNSGEISAAISQALGASAGGAAGLSPDSNIGDGAPNIKDQKVTYDGDTVHGQFLTEIGGKDVWITISGHMGQKDGYATFDPTEFKVGDLSVPVSLVNPALQSKLAEERDRLKLADPAGAK